MRVRHISLLIFASALAYPQSSEVSLLTGQALTAPLRRDFTGWVGTKFTVSANPLSVSALGRICVANNSQMHVVKLVASNGADVSGATASVNMAGCTAGQFVYGSLSPVSLQAGATYFLVSQETNGGDQWYDQGPITTTNAVAVNSSAYSTGTNYISIGSPNTSYVPVNLKYIVPTQYLLSTSVTPPGAGSIVAAPSQADGYYPAGATVQLSANPAPGCTFLNWSGALAGTTVSQSLTMSAPQSVTASFQCTASPLSSFVTGFSNNSLRNNFSGWVGLRLTVGANPLTVSTLGRICVSGNSQSHTVKLVSATGIDVAGASATVNMAGCTPSQFVFAAISTATLAAGATYYLVSQESQGGDRWYDQGPVSTTNAATVIGGVYSSGSTYIPIGSPGTSYVPVNLQYSAVVASPISVTVQTNPAGASLTVDGSNYSSAQTLTWTSASSHQIAAASPQSAGSATQYVWTGWSDGGAISHTVAPASATVFTASFDTQYLLSTSVAPSASGTISAGPSSNSGYYDAGSAVQLSATPAPGCTFAAWSGALSGTTAQQTVTMSAPRAVTATFTCSSPPALSFLTAPAAASLRNDFTGWVGLKFTVGADPLLISALGRKCVASNAQSHIVRIVNLNGTDVASAQVAMVGCSPGQFVYAPVSTALPAGGAYYLLSQETQGADRWHDQGPVTPTNAAAVNNAVYTYNGSYISIGAANTSYVPPNFQYSVVIPVPISVTVQTNPSGSSFMVDGTTYSAAQSLNWTGGSSHTISANSPQNIGAGVQSVWTSWSDGGAISHTVAPTTATTFTANYATQYQLTTSVSPAGSGSISANLAGSGGFYNAGTALQLTATPMPGCTFASWSGGLSGTNASAALTMSAPQSVTATFQCSALPTSTSLITGYALSEATLRNDFSGWVGMKLSVSGTPLTVSSLGRVCVAGNAATHIVKLVSVSDSSDVVSANVAMAGCTTGQFVYTTVTPITLPSATSYYLVSQESQGGDRWFDQSRITTTNAAAVVSSVYSFNGSWIPVGATNTSYVPPNLMYSSASNGTSSDLSAYWSFDSAHVSGSALIDQSIYGNNATAYFTSSGAGKFGNALQFNGSTSRAQVSNGSLLDLVNDLTLSAWIRTTNSSRTEAILSKYDAGGSEIGYIFRTTTTGLLELQVGAANITGKRIVTDVTPINDGNWHHVAASIQLGTSITFYVDGVPSSTSSYTTRAAAAAPDFQIGVTPYTYYGNYFTGSIDEVRVYRKALTPAEVFAIYSPAASGGAPPLVSITAPANGAQLAGAVPLSATATSSSGIYYVQYLLDGVGLLPGLTVAPYTVVWDSTRASSGPHLLTALAMDNSGHATTSASVNVIVANPPVISNGLPTGLWPARTTQLTLRVSVNQPATCRYTNTPGVSFAAMSASLSTSDSATYTASLSNLQNGSSYSFYVRCSDALGNANTSDMQVSFQIAAFNLTNGLAPTPPMGWNSWNHFQQSISDSLIRQIADAMVANGMRDAGYRYVVLDAGWEGQRDANGVLHSNSSFPDMKALADYVHSKGLKLGIYSSPGPRICDNILPGSYQHEQQDANLFAQWGVDYLKYDWCTAELVYPTSQVRVVYKVMGDALIATGRPIVYAICEYGIDSVWNWGESVGGNLWRTTYDIEDSWARMSEIGFNQSSLDPFAGPGHWNDPDMLEVGNGGMTTEEYRTHFSLWAILAAPLIAGNDVRSMTPETTSILLNTEVIQVDQDAAGIQGHRLSVSGNQEIWVKPLSGGSVAVALFNRGSHAAVMSVSPADVGLSSATTARDLWAHQSLGIQGGMFQISVAPHGVAMLRIDPQ